MNIAKYLESRKTIIDRALDKYIPPKSTYPPEIHRAMRYSLFPGGKRFRAILVIVSSEAVGGKTQKVLPSACAMELIHTYSLIHDDLPAIDNDDYRRGKLSTHRKFGEAAAILTGDALLSQAFLLITQNAEKPGISDGTVVRVMRETAEAIGSSGMVGGQIVDIRRKRRYTRKEIEYIHTRKTGALIRSSVRIGAILAGAKPAELQKLTGYGENIGLAFQIADDILDVDSKNDEPNYVSVFGAEASREKVRELVCEAKKKVQVFGKKESAILNFIADSLNPEYSSSTRP